MASYRAPKGTKVGIVGPDGETTLIDFDARKQPVEIKDPELDRILEGLAEDPGNPIRRAAEKEKD